MQKCNFNKSNYVEIKLLHGCYLVNLRHIFWIPLPRVASELNYLEKFYQSFNNIADAENLYNEEVLNTKMLKEELDQFLESANKNSKLFRYLNSVNEFVSIIKNLVWLRWKVEWEFTIFIKIDRINDLAYASFYLEETKMLPTEHPGTYQLFLLEGFIVKSNTFSFNGVAPGNETSANQSTLRKAKRLGIVSFFFFCRTFPEYLGICGKNVMPDFGVISRRWCKLNLRTLWGHVKSLHFSERIDRRRQYFYFFYKVLGIIFWKQLRQAFCIIIWICYYLLNWIRLDLDLNNSC